jgi:hypothetical protein
VLFCLSYHRRFRIKSSGKRKRYQNTVGPSDNFPSCTRNDFLDLYHHLVPLIWHRLPFSSASLRHVCTISVCWVHFAGLALGKGSPAFSLALAHGPGATEPAVMRGIIRLLYPSQMVLVFCLYSPAASIRLGLLQGQGWFRIMGFCAALSYGYPARRWHASFVAGLYGDWTSCVEKNQLRQYESCHHPSPVPAHPPISSVIAFSSFELHWSNPAQSQMHIPRLIIVKDPTSEIESRNKNSPW